MRWIEDDESDNSNAELDLIGAKYFICQMGDLEEQNTSRPPEFLPLYKIKTKGRVVRGTQLVFFMDDGQDSKRLVDFENFEDEEFQYINNFTRFGYKIYNRDIIENNNFLLIEVQLRKEIYQQRSKLFNEFDKNQIIQLMLKALLNMVTFEIHKFLYSEYQIDESRFNFFNNLELLDGEQYCLFYLDDSKKI